MATILYIDTALEVASIALSVNEQCIAEASNAVQNDHAAWLHTGIEALLKKNELTPQELDAVAVTTGPGSYTGLRVGLSSAKGLCYALQKPLITLSNLQVLAWVALTSNGESFESTDTLICPLIDARRMEVYYALYEKDLTEISSPAALIVDESSFMDRLNNKKIIFCGNAVEKFKKVCHHPNAAFCDLKPRASDMIYLSYKKYVKKEFADLVYSAPLYIKEFQQHK